VNGRRLPSPAMIVACLALLAAIGGTAFAAAKIDGADIEKDSVTGKQVKESTLKKVDTARRASKAKFADRADTAQRVAGQNVDDLRVRWLLVDEQGQIAEQSGGFRVIEAYDSDDNVYIDAGEPLAGHGLVATIAVSNQIDVYAPAGPDPNFAGEIAIARCGTTAVTCAPVSTRPADAFIVSPRNSNGTATDNTNRKRFYVELTE
jgi:hypothetical protein